MPVFDVPRGIEYWHRFFLPFSWAWAGFRLLSAGLPTLFYLLMPKRLPHHLRWAGATPRQNPYQRQGQSQSHANTSIIANSAMCSQ